jgi:NAD(P)-dependent dehydrogenase (short-subunit alcohol dehydrogenase family)
MSSRYESKVALVTGGSTGIGRAIAKRLADEGARVFITGRSQATLDEAANQHERITPIVADVVKSEDVARALEAVRKEADKLDLLVNNASIAEFAPILELDQEHVRRQFEVNVFGLIETTRLAAPELLKTRGSVVSVSSAFSVRPGPGASAYSATKGAVDALTASWAKELGGEGVRFNAVAPGPVETPIFGKTGMSDEQVSTFKQQIASQLPLGRLGLPEEIASLVAFLGSDDASYVTGSVYTIDGGYAA